MYKSGVRYQRCPLYYLPQSCNNSSGISYIHCLMHVQHSLPSCLLHVAMQSFDFLYVCIHLNMKMVTYVLHRSRYTVSVQQAENKKRKKTSDWYSVHSCQDTV